MHKLVQSKAKYIYEMVTDDSGANFWILDIVNVKKDLMLLQGFWLKNLS